MGDGRESHGGGLPDRRTAALVGIALRRHGMRRARPTLVRDGFKQVFRVEHPSRGVFSLRMYQEPPEAARGTDPRFRTGAGLRSPETLRAQLSWLSELSRRTDLAVPEPVPLPDGSLLGHASLAELPAHLRLLRGISPAHRELYHPGHPGRHFALLRWVPGEPKRDGPSVRDVARVGALVARLHCHAGSYYPPEPRALPRWSWDWPFGGSAPIWALGESFYSAAEMEVFREASRRVRRNLDGLGYGGEAFGLIHRDLTLSNLLARDGEIGAVDFDLSGFGHYFFDLSVVLRDLGRRHADRFERLRAALLEGYAGVRPLPPRQLESLTTFDAMQRVAAVNRTLELRAQGSTRPQARSERFLRQAARWLKDDYLG